jgi:hypothetical protein
LLGTLSQAAFALEAANAATIMALVRDRSTII